MKRAEGKAVRINQIERLLWSHPEGLTRTEVARRIGVHRSVITKYVDQDDLPPSIYEDFLDGKKLKIDRAADLTKASFTLHEVMAIHLATRLLATRTDKQNPHAASALRKLGMALQRLDENVSRHLLRSADVMDEDASYRDPVYLEVLETLTEAWASSRKVRVSHQMGDGRIFDYTFSPYFIEPYAVGQTAHVLGLREPPGKVRTFKVERLRSAEILREEYELPDSIRSGRVAAPCLGHLVYGGRAAGGGAAVSSTGRPAGAGEHVGNGARRRSCRQTVICCGGQRWLSQRRCCPGFAVGARSARCWSRSRCGKH